MKIIYYKRLIADKFGLTASERIVYSFMLSRAILSIDDIFWSDGETINVDVLEECTNMNDGYIDLQDDWFDKFSKPCCINKISRLTNIAPSAVLYSFRTLDSKRLIRLERKEIYLGDIWRGGYFELLMDKHKKLRGELLIFYSWIYDNSKIVKHCLNTSVERIAEKFNTNKPAMRDLIHRLHRLGLAERLEDGKLLIK